jgi:hypothetical protein
MPRGEAYRELKKTTGEDFGFNIGRWKAWLIANGRIPHDDSTLSIYQWNRLIEPIEKLLLNLEIEVPPDDAFLFVNRHDVAVKLHELTGQDFGCDAQRWRRWFHENHYPRIGGGKWLNDPPSDGS